MSGARWIEYRPLADIRPAGRNPKGHDEAGIARSFGAFGYVEPIVVDERTGRLVAGHGRLAQLAELEDKASVAPPPPAGRDAT